MFACFLILCVSVSVWERERESTLITIPLEHRIWKSSALFELWTCRKRILSESVNFATLCHTHTLCQGLILSTCLLFLVCSRNWERERDCRRVCGCSLGTSFGKPSYERRREIEGTGTCQGETSSISIFGGGVGIEWHSPGMSSLSVPRASEWKEESEANLRSDRSDRLVVLAHFLPSKNKYKLAMQAECLRSLGYPTFLIILSCRPPRLLQFL